MSSDKYFLDKKQNKKIDETIQRIISRDGMDRKTLDEVFDKQTLLSIEKLISNKTIDYLDFPISTGKEGNVFLAVTPENKFVAVKIYRINTSTFKHMAQYIEGDPRFKSFHKSKRDIIYAWASKEFNNLEKLSKHQVMVPKPIIKHNNILVMEFIGKDKQAAPLLKDVNLINPKTVFNKIINYLIIMYQKAKIVHCDLSQYNILIYDNKPYIIDLGQGVLLDHPNAEYFLKRDIHNLVTYFKKYKINADENIIYDKITKKKN